MLIGSWIAVYFVLWWVCLFAVLPFGARSQVDEGKIVPGSEPGAPAVLKLWPRLLATTILAGVLLFAMNWLLNLPVIVEYWG